MSVRLPTKKGNLEIELFEREAPLACRCLRQQISSGAWTGAQFSTVTPDSVNLSPASGTAPQVARENHRMSFRSRGLVAYGRNTTSELLFCRNGSGSGTLAGTVVGKLVNDSVFVLESIASGPQQNGQLLYPIQIGREERDPALPERGNRKRRLNIQLADERSDQLKRVIEFEKQLKGVHN